MQADRQAITNFIKSDHGKSAIRAAANRLGVSTTEISKCMRRLDAAMSEEVRKMPDDMPIGRLSANT